MEKKQFEVRVFEGDVIETDPRFIAEGSDAELYFHADLNSALDDAEKGFQEVDVAGDDFRMKIEIEAGDSVLFQRGGVWYEQLSISNIHGTASAPITFGNYGSGNLPVIDGGSTRLYGIVDGYASGQVASSYVTIDGFEIRNTTSGGIIFSYLAQPGITIENNYIHNNGYGAAGVLRRLLRG